MLQKQVVFVSRSRLSQNLLDLIVRSIPRKIAFMVFDCLAAAVEAYYAKGVQLVIIDNNTMENATSKDSLDLLFAKPALKHARKIVIYSRQTASDHDTFKACGIEQFFVKPFLPEEFVDIVCARLGIKS